MAPLPKARDHMATIAADGLIHVIGGRFDEAANVTDLHDVYDPKTDRWESGAPMPTPRSSVAYGLLGGGIVVVGGECRARKTYTEAEIYDLSTKKWSTLKSPPAGRHAFGAAAFGGALYFAGGAKGCGGVETTSEMLALTLP
jgi:N-acetylneuraminic acid mutarotase